MIFPGMDDEFAKKTGAAASFEELKEKIRDSISQVKADVANKWCARCMFEPLNRQQHSEA